MKIEDEIEVRTAVENNEYVANSYVKELLESLDEARARLAVSEKSELALLRQRDAIRDAVRNLRVLRSSCADSHNGDFRVHLCEREWDALIGMCDKLQRIGPAHPVYEREWNELVERGLGVQKAMRVYQEWVDASISKYRSSNQLEVTPDKCPRCGGAVQSTPLTPPDEGVALGCSECSWPEAKP